MRDHEAAMLAYIRLAEVSLRKRQPLGHNKLLVLAAAAACRAGWPEVAQRCRELVLEHNPAHLIGKFATVADASAAKNSHRSSNSTNASAATNGPSSSSTSSAPNRPAPPQPPRNRRVRLRSNCCRRSRNRNARAAARRRHRQVPKFSRRGVHYRTTASSRSPAMRTDSVPGKMFKWDMSGAGAAL